MDAQHTPGPWRVEDPMGPETLAVVAGGPEPYNWKWLASICSDDDFGPDKDTRISLAEMQANARLIASAPDLLEALRDVEWAAGRTHGGTGEHMPACPQCGWRKSEGHKSTCALNAALQKARTQP